MAAGRIRRDVDSLVEGYVRGRCDRAERRRVEREPRGGVGHARLVVLARHVEDDLVDVRRGLVDEVEDLRAHSGGAGAVDDRTPARVRGQRCLTRRNRKGRSAEGVVRGVSDEREVGVGCFEAGQYGGGGGGPYIPGFTVGAPERPNKYPRA